ncbi:MAG: hypothetical protein ACFE0I_13795 [Elainellaceae cyanobacterium]
MEVLKLTATIDESGYLNIRIPTELASVDVNVVVILNPVSSSEHLHSKYDFSDLAGRLTWQGDAVTAQRSLRDEW